MITKQIIENCKKGLITIVQDKSNEYMTISNHKDCDGDYRIINWHNTRKEAKHNIAIFSGNSEEEMEELSKGYKWKIVEVYREEVEPFKVGDKVRILPSIEKTNDWEDFKKYYPNMNGEIGSVFNEKRGLRYTVWQEDKEDCWSISHEYLAPLYEEVEEIIQIGDQKYNKQEVEKALKDILPHPRKLLGSVEKNDIWREGYNHCLWDIKQKMNNLDL